MKRNWPEWIKKLDHAIRNGEGNVAHDELSELSLSQVPRVCAAAVARLAWRVGNPNLGLRLLNPIVRSDKSPSTDAERAEYAVCLINAGAVEEGQALLEAITPESFPRVLFYRTFGLSACWEYRLAPPLIRDFLKLPSITNYDRTVAAVNLAAALLYERNTRAAWATLRGLMNDTRTRRQRLAGAAVFELTAVALLQKRDFKLAEQHLRDAEADLSRASSPEGFHVRKWQAVLTLMRDRNPDGIRTVREEAMKRGFWETARDCDQQLSTHLGDRDAFSYAFAGTPYAGFRERLVTDFPSPIKALTEYEWEIGAGAKPQLVALDALVEKHQAKMGGLIHRLWLTLCRDFYRPARLATLFAQLFPDEYFNPVSSPKRVHEGARRLRLIFQEARLPLDVVAAQEGYRLKATAPCRLRVSLTPVAPLNPYRSQLDELRTRFGSDGFSSAEAIKVLQMPSRTVARVLSWGKNSGSLSSQGQARSTRYKFTV